MIDSAARLFDPLSLLLVGGGTLAATLVSSTFADVRRAAAALRPLLHARPERDAEAADHAVRQIGQILDIRAIACADRVRTPVEFVREAARRLADAEDSDAFREWAKADMEARRVRHEGAVAVWRTAGEAAPAMGMIGTVIGLVSMFARMSEPSTMGAAMAVAMLTTLYGLVIAACLAGPVATRLERLSHLERRWQERALDRLEALARAEEEARQSWTPPRARAVR
ncbi:motility protein A [Sphingosinicella terrae]|uniref:motility protein A n=1 Tax=Sphingosinicella terrae TaxID=2172047 RepID=UPI000E0CC4E2|nr:MotA/TolQ/ExbB proton channel family protein [Sphingosinicella terrae]